MSERTGTVELVCPAGNMPSLRAAIDNGADAVYIGLRDGTNARNFPGLNFDAAEARRAVEHAHAHRARVFLAVNTFPRPQTWPRATAAIDTAAEVGVDAVILADAGLMRYAARTHPQLRLHLSVQGSATNREAISFYHEQFGIRRAVLPRVLSATQVKRVAASAPVEIETFAFGSLCVMVEGRCHLSSYVTGDSPNTAGVCSPAHAVSWEQGAGGARQWRLNGVLVDRYAAGQVAGYPTLCKGRFRVENRVMHAIEEPTSLNVLPILPELLAAGVCALKVEGRQRSPAYVGKVARVLRAALDAWHAEREHFRMREEWIGALDALAEGRTHTLGAYSRPWQ